MSKDNQGKPEQVHRKAEEVIPASEWVSIIGNADSLEVKNKDPERHYRFVDKNRPGRIDEMRERWNYQIEKVREGGPKAVRGKATPDNAIDVNGEMILMSCSAKEYKEREKAKTQLNKEKIQKVLGANPTSPHPAISQIKQLKSEGMERIGPDG